MIYITGDKHGRFDSIEYFCHEEGTTKEDVLIVLGDFGANYFGGKRDLQKKKYLANLPITIMAIRGNHERRPDASWSVRTIANDNFFGTFVVEPEFPSILYMQDGRFYGIHTDAGWKTAFVVGGAYSVDKYYRLGCYAAGNHDMLWFEDEQLSSDEMAEVQKSLNRYISVNHKTPDYVLTHTCPSSVEPVDMFLPGIDQSSVDKSTELFLDKILETMMQTDSYKAMWFCGHWHTDRYRKIFEDFGIRFMYRDFICL